MATPALESGDSREPGQGLFECGTYGLHRFEGSLLAAEKAWPKWSKWVPPDWDISAWRRCRLSPEEYEHIDRRLAEMREQPAPTSDFLTRQATLTFLVLRLPMWSSTCARAAAYGQLRMGLRDHYYLLNLHDVAGLWLSTQPERVFNQWGDDLPALTKFLHRAVVLRNADHHRSN